MVCPLVILTNKYDYSVYKNGVDLIEKYFDLKNLHIHCDYEKNIMSVINKYNKTVPCYFHFIRIIEVNKRRIERDLKNKKELMPSEKKVSS